MSEAAYYLTPPVKHRTRSGDAMSTLDSKRERIWFGWPWFDLRNSAALAVELARRTVPPQPTVAATPIVGTGRGPYRAPTTISGAEPTELFDARCAIGAALGLTAIYAQGDAPTVPADFESQYDDPMVRLYWYAPELGKMAKRTAQRAMAAVYPHRGQRRRPSEKEAVEIEAAKERAMRWSFAGEAASQAVDIVRKFAARSPNTTTPEGAGNANLAAVARMLIARPFCVDPDEIGDRVIHWRFTDGLRGRSPDPDLRPAFEAAWMAEEYVFAYGLLDPLPGGDPTLR